MTDKDRKQVKHKQTVIPKKKPRPVSPVGGGQGGLLTGPGGPLSAA